ncbi:hypothetical protein QZR53_26220 [Serratia marcescens]|uniref:hypothetical protein n=1 Tax=Serratia marcescens TaxID=615 RepID=UPI00276C10AA|nr:hypothetical protein [Serratia marcescens]MDP8607856.1 hypothetical protein [Serratia marcescens]
MTACRHGAQPESPAALCADTPDIPYHWPAQQRTYPALGYAVSLLPKVGVAQRADFVLDTLAGRRPATLPLGAATGRGHCRARIFDHWPQGDTAWGWC